MSEAADISRLLAQRIESLATQLLPAGHFLQGRRYWRCGSIRGEPGQSLCIWLDGPRRGRWKDYSDADARGDALDLIAAVLCCGDLGEALTWAKAWLGLRDLSPEERERLNKEASSAAKKRQEKAEREAVKHQRDAKRVWLAAGEMREGDTGWRYFLGRGVDFSLLPHPPRALRTHAGLWNAESQRSWPAIVAAICGPDGTHLNTHCIWLEEKLDGGVGKAPLDRPKLSMQGGYVGGCVRLWNGVSGKPWKDMPQGETMLAGEGLEDTCTGIIARPELRAVALLSVSSLAGLILPPEVTELIWLGQNDPRGSAANRALARALELHRAAGRQAQVLRPPVFVKDVNDWAQWLARTLPAEPDAA